MSVKNVETKDEFNETLKTSPMVVVDFYADWCGPCRMISPKIEDMSKEFSNVKFLKVNVDDLSDVAEACGVSAMPTFYFYKNGEKVADVVGANEEKVREEIKKLLTA